MPSNPKGRSLLDASQFSADAIETKLGWIRAAAGSRFDDIELSAQLLECVITDRPRDHLSDYVERVATVTEHMGGARVDLDPDELRCSPLVAVGPLDHVCQKLVESRERYGISCLSAPVDARPELMAPVIAQLAGT